MKLKLYFITYKNDVELNKTLLSLQKSDIHRYDYQITIVNNYHIQPVAVDPNFILRYKVINNQTRPHFSTGHLARNWNECLIDAFVNVNDPQTDIAVLCQNDVEFFSDSFIKLEDLHNRYSFITNGAGDALHSYTVDSVKKVGLWDERFCNIGYQEADYFLRQKMFNQNSSINDYVHEKVHNAIDVEIINSEKLSGFRRKDPNHSASLRYHGVSMSFFIKKWGMSPEYSWNNTNNPSLPQFINYPYFECDLTETARQNYAN